MLGVSDATESAYEREDDSTGMQIGPGDEERVSRAVEPSAITFTTFVRPSPAAREEFLVCRA